MQIAIEFVLATRFYHSMKWTRRKDLQRNKKEHAITQRTMNIYYEFLLTCLTLNLCCKLISGWKYAILHTNSRCALDNCNGLDSFISIENFSLICNGIHILPMNWCTVKCAQREREQKKINFVFFPLSLFAQHFCDILVANILSITTHRLDSCELFEFYFVAIVLPFFFFLTVLVRFFANMSATSNQSNDK